MSFGMIMGLMSGLGLFLYGMKMMGEGLEKAAGANLRRLLEKLTKNTFMGVLVGAVFTAIIQSSSATTVMVVGFVNAGLMNLAQATGLIMGANIGTTITGQLVAFKLTEVAPIFLLAGVVMILFFKNPRIQRIGGIVAGFGVLFVGMDLMSSAMEPLKDMPEFISLVTAFSNPVLAMLVGVAMTALIQSSSAAVGLIQILGATGVAPSDRHVPCIGNRHWHLCNRAVGLGGHLAHGPQGGGDSSDAQRFRNHDFADPVSDFAGGTMDRQQQRGYLPGDCQCEHLV